MPVWKVLLIGVLACASLSLALGTVMVTAAGEWSWVAGLLPATVCVGALFALFLKSAGHSLDLKPRGSRR